MPRIPRPFIHIPERIAPECAEINAKFALPPKPEAPEAAEVLLCQLTNTPELPSWAPQPNESALEYEAFRMWLDSGAATPRGEVARKWQWTLRKVAFEKALGATEVHSAEGRKAMSLRAVQTLKACLMIEASKLLRQFASDQHPTMTAAEAARALKQVITLERLLDGQSTENISVRGSISDEASAIEAKLAAMTEDERREWLETEARQLARLGA